MRIMLASFAGWMVGLVTTFAGISMTAGVVGGLDPTEGNWLLASAIGFLFGGSAAGMVAKYYASIGERGGGILGLSVALAVWGLYAGVVMADNSTSRASGNPLPYAAATLLAGLAGGFLAGRYGGQSQPKPVAKSPAGSSRH
jgi:hypothetical protein